MFFTHILQTHYTNENPSQRNALINLLNHKLNSKMTETLKM